MKLPRTSTVLCLAALLAALTPMLFPLQAYAQGRDYITEKEADRVREAQAIDRRVAVFVKIVERRILALTDPSAANSKQAQKDAENWGELRTGTRAELLSDIAKILDAAITNIDEASKRAPQNPLPVKALRKLAESSTQLLTTLTTLRSTTADEAARESLEQAIDNARTITQAANELPTDK